MIDRNPAINQWLLLYCCSVEVKIVFLVKHIAEKNIVINTCYYRRLRTVCVKNEPE